MSGSRGFRGARKAILLPSILLCLLLPPIHSGGQTNRASPPAAVATAAAEKEGCTRNLKEIFEAIETYRKDHKDLPNWLSDLVPDYLEDANVLVCPVCRRSGRIEGAPLADPKLPTSYLYEFCPVPLGSMLTNAPGRTRREWKRRQMGLAGSIVPIVRCRHHQPFLNLSFDGKVYESFPTWESMLTNRIALDALTPRRLFPEAGQAQKKAGKGPRFPARSPDAKPEQLDLTKHYNAGLRESWHRSHSNTLANLPVGLKTFAGVAFDVRGIIQLSSKTLTNKNYPPQAKGIVVKQKCRRIHFLHAAGMGRPEDEGTQIGAYFIRYADNPARFEIPIIYGRDVRDWHVVPGEPPMQKSLTVAWSGMRTTPGTEPRKARLFKTTWTNLLPDVAIDSIDFASSMADPAPFLIAITVE